MSQMATVSDWQVSQMASVSNGICLHGKCLHMASVPTGKCPKWQVSQMATVSNGNCRMASVRLASVRRASECQPGKVSDNVELSIYVLTHAFRKDKRSNAKNDTSDKRGHSFRVLLNSSKPEFGTYLVINERIEVSVLNGFIFFVLYSQCEK